jgi:hypothetical protein
LSKLRDHLLDRGTVAAVSRETLRRMLRDAGVSWQGTTTWKASTDPDFLAKMHRILYLYDHPPGDGRVIPAHRGGVRLQRSRVGITTAATEPLWSMRRRCRSGR